MGDGRFKGSREQGVDYFDDMFEADVNYGIYDGLGVTDHDRVREKMTPEGLEVQMNCRFCGKPHAVTLEWKELFICGSNGPNMPPLFPPNWGYSQNNGTLFCSLRCSKCHGEQGLTVHVSPEEARRHIQAAHSRGLVHPQFLTKWKGEVDMYRQQQG